MELILNNRDLKLIYTSIEDRIRTINFEILPFLKNDFLKDEYKKEIKELLVLQEKLAR